MAQGENGKSKPSVERLIRDLYGSLSEEVHFEQALHRLGAVFQSSISGLHTEDFGAHRCRLTLAGDVDPKAYQQLIEEYCTR